MAKNRFFYAYEVFRVNPGPGGEASLVKGGFLLDPAIAQGSYPNAAGGGSVIITQDVASGKAKQAIRFYQSQGIDARAEVYVNIYGEDASNPKRALIAADRTQKLIESLDVPELGLKRRLRDSNISLDPDGLADDGGYDAGLVPEGQDVPAVVAAEA